MIDNPWHFMMFRCFLPLSVFNWSLIMASFIGNVILVSLSDCALPLLCCMASLASCRRTRPLYSNVSLTCKIPMKVIPDPYCSLPLLCCMASMASRRRTRPLYSNVPLTCKIPMKVIPDPYWYKPLALTLSLPT